VLLVEDVGVDVDVGDLLGGDLDAVVVSHGGRYWLRPRTALPSISPSRAPAERTALGVGAGLAVATLNVEHLGPELDRVDRVAEAIATRLDGPAVIALHEIDRASAAEVASALVAAARRHGGPLYQPEMRPELQDGPIVSVILVDPERVDVPERMTADWAPGGQPFDNPAVLGVGEPAFSGARCPLALELRVGGRTVVVVALHLTSKWSDDPLMGARIPPRAPSTARREAQARRVAEVVSRVVEAGYDAIVLGDLNDTPSSAPLARLAEAGLVDLSAGLAEGDRYSYVYQGASQMIDYVLATLPLADGASIDVVHGQADRAASRRDTDHDGVVARLPLAPVVGK
jgi:predicted extracellular nuclease